MVDVEYTFASVTYVCIAEALALHVLPFTSIVALTVSIRSGALPILSSTLTLILKSNSVVYPLFNWLTKISRYPVFQVNSSNVTLALVLVSGAGALAGAASAV